MNKFKFISLSLVTIILLAACASIGNPEGGPRDVTPPHFVSSKPSPGTLNFKGNKISIFFDENVQLDNPNSKVAISPAQSQQPVLFANGKRVDIELKDTILPNTTYTIDLADAVKDLNEGNILDGFAIDYSTGQNIDTLSISGIVLQARNLEPAQGMLVGVYATENDSAILTMPFERIARTNELGQFTVRNLKAQKYQLFALNDNNRDLHWDRTEDVAFYSEVITPSTSIVEVADTISADSIVIKNVTRFQPDNILLTWFNEDYKAQYMKVYKRDLRNIIHLEMAAPSDSLPQLTIVSTGTNDSIRKPLNDISVLNRNATSDTLEYWLTDSTLIASDTLLIETKYRRVDSVNNLVWQTDTLKFNVRSNKRKSTKKWARTLQEKIDSIKLKSDTARIDTFALMQPSSWLELRLKEPIQELNKPLYFSFTSPLSKIDPNGVRLEINQDSIWTKVEPQPIIERVDSFSVLNYQMKPYQWQSGTSYRLAIDSLAVVDIYGAYTKPEELEFNTRKTEDYAAVTFNVIGVPEDKVAIVELLDEEDNLIRSQAVISGAARFDYLIPSNYYARLYIDNDNNGVWTNGDLNERLQPEDIYYFSKKLAIKKNWDRAETWNINSMSPELQKPYEIKKNKPKLKAGEMPIQTFDEEEEDDEFGSDDGFGNSFMRY